VIAAWKFGGSNGNQKIPNLPNATAKGAHRLVIRAVRGSTLLEVHVGSPTGKVLYQGTLQRGRSVSFPQQTVWIAARTVRNLRVTVNHHTMQLPHAHRHSTFVVTATGHVRPAA
jgi:hypothetical protein